MSRTLLSLAGFQVIISGRFWVIAEVGKRYHLSAPKVVLDPSRRRFPFPVRIVLWIVRADEYIELSNA
jgi:hypothetical protein